MIKSNNEVPFVGDFSDALTSNGIIISKAKGLVVCPKKIARIGVSNIRLTLSNQQICKGTVIYTDPITPFGIIMIEKDCLNRNMADIAEIPLGSTEEGFAAGDPAFLYGVNQQNEYILKGGHITNTDCNNANRYAGMFRFNVETIGLNPSGAAIFNTNYQCIGIHIVGTESTSYDLKAEYIKSYLAYYLDDKFDGKEYQRGDIGVSITLLVVGFEKTNYQLPAEVAEEIIRSETPSGGPPELMTISSICPGSKSAEVMKPGDVIHKVEGQIIANNFIRLDRIINSNVGKEISVDLYRKGKLIATKTKVEDTNTFKINRYVYFAGCYFHEITPLVRCILNTNENGIYLTYCTPGSPFDQVSNQSNSQKNNYILSKIDDTPINSLDDFIEFLKRFCFSQSVMVHGIDLNGGQPATNVPVDLPFASTVAKVFRFSYYGGWTSESIDLSEYCKDRTEGYINKPDDPVYEQGGPTNPSTVASTPDTTTGPVTASPTPSSTPTTGSAPRTQRTGDQSKAKQGLNTNALKPNKKDGVQQKVGKIFFESNIKIQ